MTDHGDLESEMGGEADTSEQESSSVSFLDGTLTRRTLVSEPDEDGDAAGEDNEDAERGGEDAPDAAIAEASPRGRPRKDDPRPGCATEGCTRKALGIGLNFDVCATCAKERADRARERAEAGDGLEAPEKRKRNRNSGAKSTLEVVSDRIPDSQSQRTKDVLARANDVIERIQAVRAELLAEKARIEARLTEVQNALAKLEAGMGLQPAPAPVRRAVGKPKRAVSPAAAGNAPVFRGPPGAREAAWEILLKSRKRMTANEIANAAVAKAGGSRLSVLQAVIAWAKRGLIDRHDGDAAIGWVYLYSVRR